MRTFNRLCQNAQLRPKLEQGAEKEDGSRPADVLLPDWSLGRAAALDFVVTSPLKLDLISGAGGAANQAMVAVEEAEKVKHTNNDQKCAKLDWECIPMAVNSYGVWGKEAQGVFKKVANSLCNQLCMSQSRAMLFVYNALGVVLARKNARALLSKMSVCDLGKSEVLAVAKSPSPPPIFVSAVPQVPAAMNRALVIIDDMMVNNNNDTDELKLNSPNRRPPSLSSSHFSFDC